MVLDSKKRPQGTFDSNLELDSGHQITGTGTNYGEDSDNVDIVLDVGTGLFKGMAIIDVSAISVANDDEVHEFSIQGGDDADFTNEVPLASLKIGADGSITGLDNDDEAGRYKLYFDNERNGTYYPFLRLQLVTTGTAEDITFSSYVVPIN